VWPRGVSSRDQYPQRRISFQAHRFAAWSLSVIALMSAQHGVGRWAAAPELPHLNAQCHIAPAHPTARRASHKKSQSIGSKQERVWLRPAGNNGKKR
jgi:hypothetical protein